MFSQSSARVCLLVFFSLALSAAPLTVCAQQSVPKPATTNEKSVSNSAASTASDLEYHEDFSDLSLRSSKFFPLPPAVGQIDDYPQFAFIRERLQLDWRPADPLDLYICKPRNIAKPPVVLFLYTFPGNTDRFKSDDWCGTVTANGFAGVGFLSADTGDRLEGHPPGTTIFSDFQESLGASVHDVQLILNYLATRGDMDMDRVGMFGQGSGGTIAILASAVDPRIKAIDVLTPWGDWPQFFAKTHFISKEAREKYLAPDFLAKVATLDPLDSIKNSKAKNIRLQNVRKSGPMPDELQERMEAAAPPRAIINQYGDPSALVPHASGGAIFEWIHAQLQPGLAPQVAQESSQRIHFYPASTVSPLPPLGAPAKD